MKLKFKVKTQQNGQKLLAFLREHCPRAPSVKSLKRSIESKRCKINGKVETFSTHLLKEGDLVEFEWRQNDPKALPLHHQPFLLWEDEFLAAYNKPAGVVSDSKVFSGKLIHRLDKETSGLILIAKNEKILELMIDLFRKRKIDKEYLAIVDGLVQKQEKKIKSKLAPKHHYQGQTLYGSNSYGKEATTTWKLLARGLKSSLLCCCPLTGRTHQLRVHLKEAGHPVLGDFQYHRSFYCPLDVYRHLLHAYRLSFSHPLTGEKLDLIAPIPLDFLEALQNLRMLEAVRKYVKDNKFLS